MAESSGNERLTAFVSIVVAVAILAAGLTAQQNQAPQNQSSQSSDVVQMENVNPAGTNPYYFASNKYTKYEIVRLTFTK